MRGYGGIGRRTPAEKKPALGHTSCVMRIGSSPVVSHPPNNFFQGSTVFHGRGAEKITGLSELVMDIAVP